MENMSLLDYVKGLLPVTERRELMNTIDGIREAYDTTVAPILTDVEEVFSGYTFKSKLMKDYDAVLRRNVKVQTSSFNVLCASLKNVRNNLDVVEQVARSQFSLQFTNQNLTFDRATTLKYVDAVNFYVRYGRKFLLYVIAAEAAQLGKATPMKWTPHEVDWVHTNMQQFINLFSAMALTQAELKRRLNSASNAEIHEETFELALSAMGKVQADPLELAGFSPQENPLMQLGKYIAEWRHQSYLTAKEEYYCTQLRIQEFRELQEGNPTNPVIQNRITQYERKASDMEVKLNEIEEEARAIER